VKVFITSGGTQVPIDSVRFISNMSTGRVGAELARISLLKGHKTFLYRNKNAPSPYKFEVDLRTVASIGETTAIARQFLPLMYNYTEEVFKTYDDYASDAPHQIKKFEPDIIFASAAVSDYATAPIGGKISSDGGISIHLHSVPKVLPYLRKAYPSAKLVAFKLLVGATDDEQKAAVDKVFKASEVDVVAANDLREIREGNHAYTVYFKNGTNQKTGRGPTMLNDFFDMVTKK
jgi:phosphopantothenoylcysteine synthetase/decarboxylase